MPSFSPSLPTLPERTPTYEVLTQILNASGLLNQVVHLCRHIDIFSVLDVVSRQLVLDSFEDQVRSSHSNIDLFVLIEPLDRQILASGKLETPVDERIIGKGFQNGQQRLLVVSDDPHHMLGRDSVRALDS